MGNYVCPCDDKDTKQVPHFGKTISIEKLTDLCINETLLSLFFNCQLDCML